MLSEYNTSYGVNALNELISTIDISGVALAGIKGLIKKNEELEKSIQQQQRMIDLLKAEIELIKKELKPIH